MDRASLIVPEELEKILTRKWDAGTRVTNCVGHMNEPFDARRPDCGLCQTDVRNHIAYCHRLNAFLNQVVEDALKVLRGEVVR